jgi:hypothetical protein
MKTVSILVLAALTGAAAVQGLAAGTPLTAGTLSKLEIDFAIPSVSNQALLQACVCWSITSSTNRTCTFVNRRLEEDAEDLEGEVEGEMELERGLQGGSCPNCNPGPSGYWCRLMHCRRRGLGASASASASAASMTGDIQAKAAQCLGVSASGVAVTTQPALMAP